MGKGRKGGREMGEEMGEGKVVFSCWKGGGGYDRNVFRGSVWRGNALPGGGIDFGIRLDIVVRETIRGDDGRERRGGGRRLREGERGN